MGVDFATVNRMTRGLLVSVGVMPEGVAVVSKDQWEIGNQMGVLKEDYLDTLDWMEEELQNKYEDKSIKISMTTPNDARWIQTVDVEPNTWYFLSGWIKTDNVGHTSESVDAGANLSLFGTWERSAGVFGSEDWTRNSLLFSSGDDEQVIIGARLGYWAGTTTGTAWFDDIRLTPIVPMDPHPGWKILVLIYQETDFEVTDDSGIFHHYVASMTQYEMEQAALAAKQFVETDIPALTSQNMVPEVTVRFPDHSLTQLSPIADGWWPSPGDTASERDPQFDSVIVIWDTRATDLTTGLDEWIGYGDGLAANMGTGQTYNTMQIDAAVYRGHRNVFKHEWGHSILFFYDAMGTAPKPTVSNHADATQYVNCQTGQYYVWQDETLANPIPNSIYNNESGFTHDYYSGTTATADQPTRCLGITPEAWAYGGPVSHSGNIPVVPLPFAADIDIKPSNKQNVINPREHGGVWVAILSDTDPESPFDPSSQVDISTVEFGPEGANAIRYKVKDVNKDGLGDLLLRFNIPDTGIACGDTEATLVGTTFEDQAFTGTDSITTVGCKAKLCKNKEKHKHSHDGNHHKKKADADRRSDKHDGKKPDKDKTDEDAKNEKEK